MAEFAFAPDWARPMVERWQFLTDILVADDGTEQRTRLRAAPRIELEFEARAEGADAAALAAWLEDHQSGEFDLPWWPTGGGDTYAARFLERIKLLWTTPQLARAPAKARLSDSIPAPMATVDQIGGVDVFQAPAPDWAQPRDDEWARLLAILDYKTGPLRVVDRAGVARRRWSLEYRVEGADVGRLRAFVWQRHGRQAPAWLPAPEGGLALCRLDMDEIEWRWTTPELCRCTLGVVTLSDEA